MFSRKLYDCIVIGGGIAGLSAARELAEAGRSVLVLEARDRTGGRMYYMKQQELGIGYDNGAGYVGRTQTEIIGLCEEFNLELVKVPTEGLNVQLFGGKHATYSGLIPPLSYLALIDTHFAMQKMQKEAEATTAAGDTRRALELDSITLEQWINGKVWTAGGKLMLTIACRALLCVEPSEVSAAFFAQYVAQSDSLDFLVNVTDGAQELKLATGTASITNNLERLLREELPTATVKLNAPVASIAAAKGKVTVTLQGGAQQFDARSCIVAISPALTSSVRFQPPLPAAYSMLAQRMPMGSIIKTHTFYSKPYWREKGYSGQVATDTSPVCLTYAEPYDAYSASNGKHVRYSKMRLASQELQRYSRVLW